MGAYEAVKEAVSFALKAGNVGQTQQLLAALDQVKRLEEENASLRDEVKRLKGQLELRGKMTPSGEAYWLRGEGEDPGPFCMPCWDTEERQVHLFEVDADLREESGVTHYCPKCRGHVKAGRRPQ